MLLEHIEQVGRKIKNSRHGLSQRITQVIKKCLCHKATYKENGKSMFYSSVNFSSKAKNFKHEKMNVF